MVPDRQGFEMRQNTICAIAAMLLVSAAVVRSLMPPPPDGIVRSQLLDVQAPGAYTVVDPHEGKDLDAAYHEHFAKDGHEIEVTIRHLGYAHRLDVCYRMSGWLISQQQPEQVSNRGWGTAFVAHGPEPENIACTEVPLSQDGRPTLEERPSLIDYSFAKGVRTLEVCERFRDPKEQAASLDHVKTFTREFLASQKPTAEARSH
jgi:hypothetical protein